MPVPTTSKPKKILVLERFQLVRSVIARILKSKGYVVFERTTEHERLPEAGVVDLVIADVSVTGRCSCIKDAVELSNNRPDLKLLLTSGVPADCWSEADQ